MNQGLRKFLLATHITLAVGWIGGVLAYLVLVATAMTSEDLLTLRAAWIAMELIGWYLLVPLAVSSLITGLVLSVGTSWGLLRHYWVLISLVLTTVATVVLLLHMPTVSAIARVAAEQAIADVGVLRGGLRGELLHAGLGLLVLFTIEALTVYKPLGLTAYGQRTLPQGTRASRSAADVGVRPARASTSRTPRWAQVVGFHAIGLALLFVIMHLITGGGTHH